MASIPSEKPATGAEIAPSHAAAPSVRRATRIADPTSSLADSFDAILQTTLQSCARELECQDVGRREPAPEVSPRDDVDSAHDAPEAVDSEPTRETGESDAVAEVDSKSDEKQEENDAADARQDEEPAEEADEKEDSTEAATVAVKQIDDEASLQVADKLAVDSEADDEQVIENAKNAEQKVANDEVEIIDLSLEQETEPDEDGKKSAKTQTAEGPKVASTVEVKEVPVKAAEPADEGEAVDELSEENPIDEVNETDKTSKSSKTKATGKAKEAETQRDVADTAEQSEADSASETDAAAASRRVRRRGAHGPAVRAESVEAPTTTAQTAEASTAPTTSSQPRLPERLLSTTRASTSTEGARTAQETRLIGRISRAFQAAQQRGGPLRIRLHPRELGSLKIELQVEKGVMTAKLEVETNSARTAILDNLPNLRERLNEQGIRVEQFDVGLSGGGDQATADLDEQQTQQREGGGQTAEASGEAPAAEDGARADDDSSGDGRLNVVV